MLNGRCKVWKDEDGNYHAMLAMDTPKGVIQMKRTALNTDAVGSWDPNSPETGPGTLIKKKVEYIAGYFPTERAVGKKAADAARGLMVRYAEPSTRTEAEKEIMALKQAVVEGNDDAFDVDYALRRFTKEAKRARQTGVAGAYARGVLDDDSAEGISAEADVQTEIGKLSFKKFGKWVKKNPVKAIASAVFPPAAAFIAVRELHSNSANARRKIASVRRLAAGKPAEPGLNVPDAGTIQQAQKAVENLRKADALQQQGVVPESYYEDDGGEGYEGDEEYADDTVGGPFDFIKKAVRKGFAAIDPTRKGSFMGPLLANLPFVGPGVKASLELLDSAKKLNKSSIEKIKTVKSLAEAGVPKAVEAKKNLQTAQAIQQEAERLAAQGASTGKASKVGKRNWFPFFNTYHAGLTKGVA